MMRWIALAIVAAALCLSVWWAMRVSVPPAPYEPNPVAVEFVARYVDKSGRILDTANGGISHSEGQGYGLLMAEAAGNRPAFDRILAWTLDNLAVRDDGLLSWRWDPDTQQISDSNNASDGEVLIAWALLRADDRWDDATYRRQAMQLLDGVEAHLIRPSALGPVVIPGVHGFEHDGSLTLNLSYWVFPAMERFAAEGRGVWAEVSATGYELASKAGFGEHSLPSDWIRLDASGEISPADGWPPEFGYNAVRIPLHLCWAAASGDHAAERRTQLLRYNSFWSEISPRATDRWNVASDEPSGGPAPPAYGVIARLAEGCDGADLVSEQPIHLEPGEAYYSAALKGLASLAVAEAPASR